MSSLPRVAAALAREVFGFGRHAINYPTGVRRAPILQCKLADGDTFGLPVVLVHGYFHNRSGFHVMSAALRERGFAWVHGMNYNPVGNSIESLASVLSERVDEIMKISGAPRVHLVGHSLGGLIARWYAQEMCPEKVDHCVTIGAPHHGTFAAFVGPGRTARQMQPGSGVVKQLAKTLRTTPVRFVNVYSDLDALIIPSSSAVLPDGPNVDNRLMPGLGHGSMLLEDDVVTTVVNELACADVNTPLAEVKALRLRQQRRAASSGS